MFVNGISKGMSSWVSNFAVKKRASCGEHWKDIKALRTVQQNG